MQISRVPSNLAAQGGVVLRAAAQGRDGVLRRLETVVPAVFGDGVLDHPVAGYPGRRAVDQFLVAEKVRVGVQVGHRCSSQIFLAVGQVSVSKAL